MKKYYINKNFAMVVAVAAVGLLMVSSAKANLNLSCSSGANFFSGESNPTTSQLDSICGTSQIGSCVYQDSFGFCSGALASSYQCSYGFNSINYLGGDWASASCFIVHTTSGCYVWNLGGVDVNQQVNCDLKNCKGIVEECCFYGSCKTTHQTSSVPEPSTVVAGALLLLPLGLQTIRQFRKRAQVGETKA
jgi:hypothetical protein